MIRSESYSRVYLRSSSDIVWTMPWVCFGGPLSAFNLSNTPFTCLHKLVSFVLFVFLPY